jgi:hypothetical protein
MSAANAAKIGSAGRADCLQISLLWLDLLLLLDYGPGFVVIRQPQPSLRHVSSARNFQAKWRDDASPFSRLDAA